MYKKSMINLLVSIAVGLGIAFSSAVWAKNPEMAVKKRDSNGDGKVSLDEWDKKEFIFNKIDLDGDGYLTAKEFAIKWGMPVPGQETQVNAVQGQETQVNAESAKFSTSIPIADFHFHPGGGAGFSPSGAIELMNDTGVKWAGSGVSGGRGVSGRLWEQYSNQMGDRFIPFAGQKEFNYAFLKGGTSAMLNPYNPIISKFLQQIENDLETGKVKGVGELFINNMNSNSNPRMRRKVELDAPIFRDLYQLLAKHNAFLTIHMEAHPDSVEQMENLLSSDRNGRILWNHCGSTTSSGAVRTLLASNSNLFCELSFRFMHKKASRNIFLENWIDSGWLELIEDFPDRFLIGTDAHSDQQYRKYVKVVRSGLLSNLSPSAARKVAHENAQYLFGLQ